MYVEIKTDDPAELRRAFDEVINKGQQAMLTLGKDGDFVDSRRRPVLLFQAKLYRQHSLLYLSPPNDSPQVDFA